MRAELKLQRQLAKNAELLSKLGYNVGNLDIKETAAAARVQKRPFLESTLHAIRKPADFAYKKCKREACGQPFGTNYHAVAYCSDNCRAKEFERLTGLKFHASGRTEEERWGGEPPEIIPPELMRTLLPFAQKLVEAAKEAGIEAASPVAEVTEPKLKVEQPQGKPGPAYTNPHSRPVTRFQV